MTDDLNFMTVALEEARYAAARGEAPVGAVVVSPGGRILAAAGNSVRSHRDPTGHAVLVAIRNAAEILDADHLEGCDLYVTVEPCAMCAKAIAFARIRRLYYGLQDPKGGGVDGGARIFDQPTTPHVPEIRKGVLADEVQRLLNQRR